MHILKYKNIKKFAKILGRLFLGLFIAVYVIVAIVNYSIVQSVVGSMASSYFSNEWGGTVKVRALGANPFHHLVLRDVELISPTADTICRAHTIYCRFDGFPYDKYGLSFQRVRLHDVYYHLVTDSNGINLQYIINYFKPEHPKQPTDEHPEFKVVVGTLVLDNVHYKQDLKERPAHKYAGVGVDIPHMEYDHIKARFRNVRVDKDHITCRIDHLSTHERSGLDVKDLQMNVNVSSCGINATNMVVETADSRLVGDVQLRYRHWEVMKHFLDSVDFTCHFDEGSYGSMRDASYWAPTLWGMDQTATIEGDFYGPLSDFHASDVYITMGDGTLVDFDASMVGLPYIDSTIIRADIHRLRTTYDDLAAVKHPRGITMKAPGLIKSLNVIDMRASFEGTVFDFVANFDIESDAGPLRGDVEMLIPHATRACTVKKSPAAIRYSGHLASEGFSVGSVVRNEWVSRAGIDLTFKGEGFDPRTMQADVDGRFNRLVVRGNRLTGNATLNATAGNGTANARFFLNDELVYVDLNGDMLWSELGPRLEAQLAVQHTDLARLGLWFDEADTTATIGGVVTAHYAPLNANSNNIYLLAEQVTLRSNTRRCNLNRVALTSTERDRYKDITLNSDMATAHLTGYFDYKDMGGIVQKFVRDYMPASLVSASVGHSKGHAYASQDFSALAADEFELDLLWHDTTRILQAFQPKLHMSEGSSLQVNYNFRESFKIILRSDSLRYGGVDLSNIAFTSNAAGDRYRARLTFDTLQLGTLVLCDRANNSFETSRGGASCRLYWENGSEAIGDGDINVRLISDSTVSRIVIDPSQLEMAQQIWNIVNYDGDIYLADGSFVADGLVLESGEQRLAVDVARLHRPDDAVTAVFNQFGLSVLNPFLAMSGMKAGGEVDGRFFIEGFDEVPHLTAKLTIDELELNEEPLGDATLSVGWDANMDQLNLFVQTDLLIPSEGGATQSQPIWASGYVALGQEHPELNFRVFLEDLNLHVAEPFVRSFSSQLAGTVNGELQLGGTLSQPTLNGQLAVNGGAMQVDFLNVQYRFDDTLYITDNNIRLSRFAIHDPRGNVAYVDGSVYYADRNHNSIALTLAADQFLCMNTTPSSNSPYGGVVLASLTGQVIGPVDNIDIAISATTLRGSALRIPIDNKRQFQSADYIHFGDITYTPAGTPVPWTVDTSVAAIQRWTFVSENTEQGSYTDPAAKSNSRYHLTIDVDATPDMVVLLPVDMSTISADVRAAGSGDLQLTIGTDQPFSIRGDYELDAGTIVLDLAGLVTRDFTIDQGGTVNFPGNIGDANFDIKAAYSQRVNMSTLTGSLDATESQKLISVESVIALSGSLQNPQINYDIRLPNADQSVQEEVFAYIDRTNERDMLNQTISLLAFNRFYSSSTSTTDANATLTDQGYSLMANTLGSLVSGMVDFVDVNFDYKAGNALTTEQVGIDISKEWNKFYFETTLGFGGEAREMDQVNNANNMTGDVLVGYKINPRLHLYVFNRSNTNDYTRSDLPYKQGAGLKYTRDFDRWSDLFSRSYKKKNTLSIDELAPTVDTTGRRGKE